MSRRIYITHCTANKNPTLKGTGIAVTPDKLYTGSRIVAFMGRCKQQGVPWAILSDKYGIIFPNEEIQWYELDPNQLSKAEQRRLSVFLAESMVKRFTKTEATIATKEWFFDEIWFYHNPPRFHKVYRAAIEYFRYLVGERPKIILFSKVAEIHHENPLYQCLPAF